MLRETNIQLVRLVLKLKIIRQFVGKDRELRPGKRGWVPAWVATGKERSHSCEIIARQECITLFALPLITCVRQHHYQEGIIIRDTAKLPPVYHM